MQGTKFIQPECSRVGVRSCQGPWLNSLLPTLSKCPLSVSPAQCSALQFLCNAAPSIVYCSFPRQFNNDPNSNQYTMTALYSHDRSPLSECSSVKMIALYNITSCCIMPVCCSTSATQQCVAAHCSNSTHMSHCHPLDTRYGEKICKFNYFEAYTYLN